MPTKETKKETNHSIVFILLKFIQHEKGNGSMRPMKITRRKKSEVANSFLIKSQHQRKIVLIHLVRLGAAFISYEIEELACFSFFKIFFHFYVKMLYWGGSCTDQQWQNRTHEIRLETRKRICNCTKTNKLFLFSYFYLLNELFSRI